MIVNAELGAGESLQNDTEPSGCDVKAARLQPDALRIRNPEAVIVHVDVRDKVVALPSIWIKPISATVERGGRHLPLSCELNFERV